VGNRFCRSWFGIDPDTGTSSTNPITGKVQGPPTAGVGYDPTVRPWYINSISSSAPGAVWSAPYVFSAGDDAADTPLGITATRQVITSSGQTLGVFGIDYELSQIGVALQAAVQTEKSTFTMFIVEEETLALISASVPGVSVDEATLTQVLAVSCANDVIRTSSRTLTKAGGFAAQSGVTLLTDVPGKGLHWVQSNRLDDSYGLDWHLVVVQLVLCEQSFYAKSSADVDDVCQPCPVGAVCNGGTWLPYPKRGFWADMTNTDMLMEDMPKCREPDNCKGGGANSASMRCFQSIANLSSCVAGLKAHKGGADYGSDFLCSEGAGGRLCDVCDKNEYFMKTGYGCESCENSGSVAGTVVTALLIVLIAIVAVFVYYRGEDVMGVDLRNNAIWRSVADPARFKILWATAQIVSSVSFTTSVSWPDPFRSMSKVLGVVQLSFAEVVPTSCFSPVNYYQQLLVSTLVPVGIIGLLQFVSHPALTNDKEDRWGLLIDRGWGIYMMQLVGFCVLPSTSLTIFQIFQCHEFNDGASYLTSDMSISCDTAQYDSYFAYAVFCIIVYPVGIPLSFFVVLYLHKEGIMARDPLAPVPKKLEKYAFLFVDYATDMWHGEVFRSVMRVMLSAMVVTISSSSVSRASWGSILAFGYLVITREYQAFLKPSNNAMALGAQYQIFFTYVMAFFLTADPFVFNTSDKTTLSTLLLVVNLVVFALAILQSSKEAKVRVLH